MADYQFEYEITLDVTDRNGDNYYLYRRVHVKNAILAELEAVAMVADLNRGKAVVEISSIERTYNKS